MECLKLRSEKKRKRSSDVTPKENEMQKLTPQEIAELQLKADAFLESEKWKEMLRDMFQRFADAPPIELNTPDPSLLDRRMTI